jgi:FAD dependent oxidoreductase
MHACGACGQMRQWQIALTETCCYAQQLCGKDASATVEPIKLANAFVRRASEMAGTRVLKRIATGVATSHMEDGSIRVTGVRLSNSCLLDADSVIVCMGPWSALAAKWLGMSDLPIAPEQKWQNCLLQAAHAARACCTGR